MMNNYEYWLTLDSETRAELEAITDKAELEDRFYKELEFGTGGMRGVMGAGANRMNKYTVARATKGLADMLTAENGGSVAIAYDSRRNSADFARTAAGVLCKAGIKVYLFDTLMPTPVLSFAVRYHGCSAGIVITASHNPKEYNGYKAYWNDGAQMVAPHDTNTIDYVNKIKSVTEVKFEGNKDLIQIVGEDIDSQYIAEIKKLSLSPDVIAKHHDLKIVYTPIHGTGKYLIPRSLKNFGFTNIISVPEQEVQSGDFPTVDSPNPENASAMAMAIAKAKEVDADIVMASDPDADRIGVVIKNTKGEYELVNGNQIVMIFLYYLMARNKELGKLTGNEYIVKTIVTTDTIKSIAEKQNIKLYDVFTGFKWIATVMRENEGKARYLGGGEESYGFLAEDFVRDKDSVSAISLMAEIAAWAKEKGLDMNAMLIDIYMTYGYSKEKGVSLVRKGKSGAEEIQAIMKQFRENPPKSIAGSPVVTVKDFATLEQKNIAAGTVEKLVMPTTSNVLQYYTEDGTKISIRPSGTEPKIKFYIEVHGTLESAEKYDETNAAAEAKIARICKELGID